MTILISPLEERHLIAAEEETGVRFVESFRKFLLQDRYTVIDEDFELSGPQIISFETLKQNYEFVEMTFGGFAIAKRV